MKIGMDFSPESVTRVSTCVKFAFDCSKQWLDLQKTAHHKVRHCNQCDKSVFWADTEVAALAHARLGRCVALKQKAVMMVGVIAWPPPTPPPFAVRLLFEWGQGFLWSANGTTEAKFGNGPLEDQLPLLPETRQRLQLLADWHAQSLNATDPSELGPWKLRDYTTFEEAAVEAFQLVRQDLGETFRVEYVRL